MLNHLSEMKGGAFFFYPSPITHVYLNLFSIWVQGIRFSLVSEGYRDVDREAATSDRGTSCKGFDRDYTEIHQGTT